MNISKALKKINDLNQQQLEHFYQLANEDVLRYKHVIRNYSPEDMEKYGLPYLRRLEAIRDEFESYLC